MFGYRRKLPEQRQCFENNGEAPVEIWIEMIPRRYIIQPGDKMEVWADPPPTNEGFTTIFHADSIQVYAGWDCDPRVSINGVPAEGIAQTD
jgi:hypothetical protein